MYCVAYKNHCRKNKKNFADVAINNICEDREKAYIRVFSQKEFIAQKTPFCAKGPICRNGELV